MKSPPNASGATGFITVTLHDDLVTLDVAESFSGLNMPAIAAHIHCCVAAGSNGPVALPFPSFPITISDTYSNTFDLDTDLLGGMSAATFVAGLEGGLAYANIHDSIFPGGEIRGQLEAATSSAVPEPSALILLGTGLLALPFFRRRAKIN
jgi:hypothetical protein